MRQKVAGMIHQVNSGLAVLNSDMHVQAEDQISAGDELHIFDDIFVTRVGMNFLHPPIAKGMRSRRGEP